MKHLDPCDPRLLLAPFILMGLTGAACSSSGGTDKFGLDPNLPRRIGGHIGPAVADSEQQSGPGRFVAPLLGIFESGAAMAVAADIDEHYRSPGSVGYEAAMDSVLAGLYGAGFGAEDGFDLKVISAAMATPAWTPLSAEINRVDVQDSGPPKTFPIGLFEEESDPSRLLMAEGSVACDLRGPVVFSMEDVSPGSILMTTESVRNVEQKAVEQGAVGVISSRQLPYCVDPTGRSRHNDAIFHGSVRPGSTLPSFYVSPRMARNIERAVEEGATLELIGRVATAVRELRTVVATIRGTERPDEAIYVVTAVSGAGANDNAAGAAGMLEGARSLKRLIGSGQIERPRRTVHFVFGKEAEAGGTALDEMDDTPVAGVVADMIGASYGETGAICLLERGWDPGALVSLPPDAHTPWGAGSVAEEDIVPNGLSLILREALVDVGEEVAVEAGAPWTTREHPWEGGSDHDTFLGRGIPAALVWHFTDFAYGTSLDRMANVDPDELRRTSVAIMAAAMAVADAQPADLPSYMESLTIERDLRLRAASASESGQGIRVLWTDWFSGAERWLRALTQGQPTPELEGLRSLDSIEVAR